LLLDAPSRYHAIAACPLPAYRSYIYYSYHLLLKVEFGNRAYSCSEYYAKFPDAPPVGVSFIPLLSRLTVPRA